MKKLYKQNGYSMVEVLVAITVLLLAIAGPLTIAHKGLQSAYFARDQITAYMLAQEGIEIVIALRNEQAIQHVNGSIADPWSWIDVGGPLDDCINNAGAGTPGCNLDIDDLGHSGDDILDELQVVSCANLANCVLDYDPNKSTRSRYYTNTSNSNTDSPYTRIITLQRRNNANNNSVSITSEVRWNPTIGNGTTQSIKLRSEVFNLYDLN